MDKSVSQFKEVYKVSGEEYLLLTYPNISNAKIKLKHIIGSIDFVINGVTKQLMWLLMKAPTDEQINISHLNNALQNYPTIDWVKRLQYLTIEDVDDFVTEALLNLKQDLLVNGINIKTINGISVLGKGDINTLNIEWRNVLDKPSDIVNISDRLAEKLDTDLYNSDKELFANKSDLEDKVDKSEIADMATETWVTQQGFLTEHQDISNLATKTEVVEGLASKLNKGNYALKSDLNDLATKDELATKADTSALSAYATKTELAGKADTSALDAKADKTALNNVNTTLTERIDDIVIPTDISAFNNDVGYLTEHQDISGLATKEELSTKQDILTSGVNIVTINGQSLLNGGNIEIEDNGITDAPTDDKIYGRKNGNWSIIEDNVGKVYQSDIYPNAEIFNDYENNIAFGQYAHAEGRETNATGSRAHAEGYKTSVYAADAHAEGRETWAMASQAHVEGLYTIGLGSSSHVEGSTEVDLGVGEESPIILSDTEKIRNFLGNFTTQVYPNGDDGNYYFQIDTEKLGNYIFHGALGVSTHAEGINNVVCDKAGHVEGYNNVAGDMIPGHGQDRTIYAPHVEGIGNKVASLLYAVHVGGSNCIVHSGNYSFAHGYNLSISNNYETSFGKYNASEIDGKKVLFSYGIGSSDTNRKNAISVFEDGSVAIPNLVGFDTDINQKLESLESEITETINTFNNKIINIYNKLSNGDITSPVFVLNDTLIITNRIDTIITDTDLAINDEMFIFADGDLSYNSNDGYLTKATYENGNLIFESTNE